MSSPRQFLHRFYHNYIEKSNLYKFVAEYERSQYYDEEHIELYQLQKFNQLLSHSIEHVPYYSRRYSTGNFPKTIKNKNDIALLPVLTKEIIRENIDMIKSQNLPNERFIKNSTSGSSGTNLKFFSDRNSNALRQALNLRCHAWMGRKPGMKILKIWGASWDVAKSNTLLNKLKAHFQSLKVLSGYKMSDDDLASYASIIIRWRPYLLVSYPSILFTFANYILANNIKLKVEAIQTGGEKLFQFQRELIESVFNAKVYDFYGARDMPMIAMQCGHDTGLHIMSENVYLEVIDQNGNPVEEGEGELIITDLHNYVFPFIRYKIGDRAIISKRRCKCGRTLPLIEEVLGRSFDVIRFPNGNRVGGTFWTLVLRSVDGIRDFQVVQADANNIRVKYVPECTDSIIDYASLKQKICQYAGAELNLIFDRVDFIPKTTGGKSLIVIASDNQ